MTALADSVLRPIRTRTDLRRWKLANAHGAQMHQAVAILRQAADHDPADVFAVTQRAIASALTVIMRADDSSGIIGDACRDLLELHTAAAVRARVRPKIDWASSHSGEWFTLDWNAQRLAVLDRDVDAIIRTHARDRRVAAWFQDTAVALMEIGEIDTAIDWAKQAADFDDSHQSRRAAATTVRVGLRGRTPVAVSGGDGRRSTFSACLPKRYESRSTTAVA
ncbi:hypothetical protein [Mycolicibacterium sp.]|uniref:hypothetical protein n=1 Tax=Mycolicibacterium sp. TaxID=2320850 RepID=UPI0037CC84B2